VLIDGLFGVGPFNKSKIKLFYFLFASLPPFFSNSISPINSNNPIKSKCLCFVIEGLV